MAKKFSTLLLAVILFSCSKKIEDSQFRIQSGKNKVEFTGYLGHNPDVFKESFFDKYLSL